MKYPREVQERIDFLNQYAENDSLDSFDILHMYAGGLGFENDGYWDARIFTLIGFNGEKMQKRVFKNRDALFTNDVRVRSIQIFADGSTVITFREKIGIPEGKAVFLEKK